MAKEPFMVKGIEVMRYDIFEIVKENGRDALRKSTVFTEKPFFYDPRQEIADEYLSRYRLDRKGRETGGYIGYWDTNGMERSNPVLSSYFDISKRIEIVGTFSSGSQPLSIPTFREIRDLGQKYKMIV